MTLPIVTPIACALLVAGAGAFTDIRTGTIPNWIALPPLVVAPLVYALATGPEVAMKSLSSAFVSGIGPYLLFRYQAMGGGDVKLFAALGAITGSNLFIGLQIQLVAFTIAMLAALLAQAWRGRLLTTLASAAAIPLNQLLPLRYQLRVVDDLRTPVRLGPAVFLATAITGVLSVSESLRV